MNRLMDNTPDHFTYVISASTLEEVELINSITRLINKNRSIRKTIDQIDALVNGSILSPSLQEPKFS